MVEEQKDLLLKKFLDKDQTVCLISEKDDFLVELSLTSATLFSPIMRQEINNECKVIPVQQMAISNSDNENKTHAALNITTKKEDCRLSFKVDGYRKDDVEEFVSYLHGKNVPLFGFTWDQCVPIIKLCHKFHVKLLKDVFLLRIKFSLQSKNVFEAVELMDLCSINLMHECCVIIQNNLDILKDQKCEEIIEIYPRIMAKLLRNVAVTAKLLQKSIIYREKKASSFRVICNARRRIRKTNTSFQSFQLQSKNTNFTNADDPTGSIKLFNSSFSSDLIKETLFDAFCEQDNQLTLINRNNATQVQLSITAATYFSPILDRYVRRNENESILSYSVSCVLTKSLDNFVSCLLGGKKIIRSCEFLDVVKLSHQLQIDWLSKDCIKKGHYMINNINFFECIRIMEIYGIHEWIEPCLDVIKCNEDIMTSEEWEKHVKENPNIISQLLLRYLTFKRRKQDYCQMKREYKKIYRGRREQKQFTDFGSKATQRFWYGSPFSIINRTLYASKHISLKDNTNK